MAYSQPMRAHTTAGRQDAARNYQDYSSWPPQEWVGHPSEMNTVNSPMNSASRGQHAYQYQQDLEARQATEGLYSRGIGLGLGVSTDPEELTEEHLRLISSVSLPNANPDLRAYMASGYQSYEVFDHVLDRYVVNCIHQLHNGQES
jgi:hypothetical protein